MANEAKTMDEWFGLNRQPLKDAEGAKPVDALTQADLLQYQNDIMAGKVILKNGLGEEFVVRNNMLCPIVRA